MFYAVHMDAYHYRKPVCSLEAHFLIFSSPRAESRRLKIFIIFSLPVSMNESISYSFSS